jgi:hypothetical protein
MSKGARPPKRGLTPSEDSMPPGELGTKEEKRLG